MNWGDWTPQENVILSIREVLQEALIPDNEIQKNVQQKLNIIQNIGDFTYYLLFIMSNPNYSEEIRSLSGILMKNNINSFYDSISQDHRLRIRQECLRLLQDPCKDIRISISNVLVSLAKDDLGTWPELIPFLMNAFDVSNEFSEIALNTLFKICEELIRNNKSDEEIFGITRKVFPRLNEMLEQEKCTFQLDIIRLVNQFLQEYFMIVKQSLDLGYYLRNVMKYADSEDAEMQKQVSMTFVLYLDNREDSLLPHLHEVILYLLDKTQHKDNEVALQACEFWITATKLSNCKELLSPYMEKLLPILLKNMKYSEYELMALKDCLGNDSNEKDQAKDIYRRCPKYLISFLSRVVIEKTRSRCKKQPLQCGFNPSDNAYEPLKLMQTVIQVINDVCFNYKSSLNVQNTNVMAMSNPLPAPETVYNVVSVSSLKNSRRKMEDRSIVINDLHTIFTKQDATPSHYFAVFDGHDGEHASAYCSNHLHQFLAESSNFATDPEQAIRDAFMRTDSMFLEKCEMENIVGGTTAVCALLLPKENTLYIAWVGDSQAALVSPGKVLFCVNPHRPDRKDERHRIKSEGGAVIHWGVWRVNGKLSVSRAIGDSDYKPYVTAVPDIIKIPLDGSEDFLVLGSDGLWDHIHHKEMVHTVYKTIRSDPDKAELASRQLVQVAKQNGSSDNISVIVVFLKDPHQIAAEPLWYNPVFNMDTVDNVDNDIELLFGFKKTDDVPNKDLIKMLEKSNCERVGPDFDTDDNLGPETDVDNPEDGSISPNVDVMRQQSEAMNNNFNPFNDIEKVLKINLNVKEESFEDVTRSDAVEENSPLPSNSVHNVSQLVDTGAESDSEEDEGWNYVRGEEANKENILPLQLNSQDSQENSEDTMSQLNPNAAEFVPVSPTRSVPSPLDRVINDEMVISRSPMKPPANNEELELNVPSPVEFEKDISCRPHEIEEELMSNGHKDDESLNNAQGNEFHFGPNATPFTPVKLLDHSEASSTRAVYGDDTEVNFDDSDFVQKDDPMSVSFHQDRNDDSNPFDLNKVHILPDDVDEFIAKKEGSSYENSLLNETISDLIEHHPLGDQQQTENVEIHPEEVANLSKQIEEVNIHSRQADNVPVTDLDLENNSKELIVEEVNVERTLTSLVENVHIESPIEDVQTVSPVEDVQLESLVEHVQIESPVEHVQIESTVEDVKIESPVGDVHVESLVEVQGEEIPIQEEEEKKESTIEQMKSQSDEKDLCSPVNEEVPEFRQENTVEDVFNINSCDNFQIPQHLESDIPEPSPNNDAFVPFQYNKPETVSNTANELEQIPQPIQPTMNLLSDSIDQLILSPKEEIEDNVVSSTNLIETCQDFIPPVEISENATLSPEKDQPLIPIVSDNSSESVIVADVHSLMEKVDELISPNVSAMDTNEAVAAPVGDDASRTPVQETPALPEATSTPFPSKSSSSLVSTSQAKAGVSKTPKAQTPKETEKKTPRTKASTTTASPATAKKTPTPRTLGVAKTSSSASSPRPAARSLSKPSSQPSKATSTGSAEAKTNVKSSTAATKTAASAPRVPLSSRTTKPTATGTKPLTNGDSKPPSSRPATGTVRKTVEASSTRSATGTSRPLSSVSKTSTLPSSRSATTTSSSTLRSKPTTTKATSGPSTMSHRMTATSSTKSSTTSRTGSTTDSKDSKTTLSARNNLKLKPTTDKQVKETANKMAASRTTTRTNSSQVSSSRTLAAKKSDDKVPVSQPGIKAIKKASATTTTKVGKPKENGVAPNITEQIIVNNASNQGMNGINGDEQFVKDNSPIDNKLIIENPQETAAI